MIIKVNYTVSDIYMSTSVSAVYIKVVYSGVSGGGGTVTSVGLTMPSAFGVANSPITSSGTLAVTALGSASQYIRGDGELATLPTGGSGGSAVSYYLNGGTAASVGTYFQMSTTAVIGTNADFTITGNGLISQFLTDVGDPNRLQIPAGNWNFEMFFSMSSSGGNTAFYVELLKYDGTTFTSIASSSAIPETISGGTAIDLYLTSLAIPATTLLTTDRLALRVYIVNNSGGRTATLHTQDSHLCQIITNFAGGISALNGLTANTQYFATGTSGSSFNIVSSGDTHTFNFPSGGGGSMAIGGSITSATAGSVLFAGTSGVLQQDNANLFWDDTNNRLGIGTNAPAGQIDVRRNDTNTGSSLYLINTNTTNISNRIVVGEDTTTNFLGFGWYPSGLGTYKSLTPKSAYMYVLTGGSALAFTTSTTTQPIKFCTDDWTERMRITGAGRLLLGTTSESTYILDVNGTARVSGSTTFGTLGTGTGMFWDNTNNRLGIGTATPTNTLDVASNSTIDALKVRSTNIAGYSSIGFFDNANAQVGGFGYANTSAVATLANKVYFYSINKDMIFTTNGATNIRQTIFQATGNIQIGSPTSDSGFKLDVIGTSKFGDNSVFASTLPSTLYSFNKHIFLFYGGLISGATNANQLFVSNNGYYDGTNNVRKNAGYASGMFFDANGNTIFSTSASSTAGSTITYSEIIRFTNTSNVLIGTATDVASSKLTIESTTQGFLPPRMTTTQKNAIATPAAGLQVYDSTLNQMSYYNGTTWVNF